MSAQGGYDGLSEPHLPGTVPEDDDIEQILLDMVDEGELELVWLEDQGEFGFFKPEPVKEVPQHPIRGAHAAPRPPRTVGLRRCAVLTVAAFVSPFIVGTAYASVVKGKPTLPVIVPDTPDPSVQAHSEPPAVTTPTETPKPAQTVPSKAPKPSTASPAKPAAQSPGAFPEHHRAPASPVAAHPVGKHRRQLPILNDGDLDRDDGVFYSTGRHRRDYRCPEDREHLLGHVVVQPPISPLDLLHHAIKRRFENSQPQVLQGVRVEGGDSTGSEKHPVSTDSRGLDRTGNKAAVWALSSATPQGTTEVSAA